MLHLYESRSKFREVMNIREDNSADALTEAILPLHYILQ